jgi:hypothetical protein
VLCPKHSAPGATGSGHIDVSSTSHHHPAGSDPGRSPQDHPHPSSRRPHRRPPRRRHHPSLAGAAPHHLRSRGDRWGPAADAERGVIGTPRHLVFGRAPGVHAPCPGRLAPTARGWHHKNTISRTSSTSPRSPCWPRLWHVWGPPRAHQSAPETMNDFRLTGDALWSTDTPSRIQGVGGTGEVSAHACSHSADRRPGGGTHALPELRLRQS